MVREGGQEDVMRRVAAILFQESFQDVHTKHTGYSSVSVHVFLIILLCLFPRKKNIIIKFK